MYREAIWKDDNKHNWNAWSTNRGGAEGCSCNSIYIRGRQREGRASEDDAIWNCLGHRRG